MDNITEITPCGCCEGPAPLTPAAIDNRAGLSAIAYRIGTYASFRQTMLDAISASRELVNLTTRDDDDYAITLLDMWAAVGDILTFYQERIANESFLRTATQRDSILRMVRLLDYHLRPGIAAAADLAFTLDAGATMDIPIGLRVMSLPAQNETPQFYETIEEIAGDSRYNKVRIYPIPTSFNPFAQGGASAILVSDPAALKQRDTILFYDLNSAELKSVKSITATDTGPLVTWDPPVLSNSWLALSTHAAKYTKTLRLFGNNVPSSYQLFQNTGNIATDNWITLNLGTDYSATLGSDANPYFLDSKYKDLTTGTALLIETGNTAFDNEPNMLVVVTSAGQSSASLGPLQDTVTSITLTRYMRSAPGAAVEDPAGDCDIFFRSGEDSCVHVFITLGEPGSTSECLTGLAIASTPASVIVPSTNIYVFAQGFDDSLHVNFFDQNQLMWSQWTTVSGATIKSAPAVAVDASGSIFIAAVGTDGAVWTNSYDPVPDVWKSWTSIGGTIVSTPSVVVLPSGDIYVFGLGTDNAVWYNLFYSASSAWLGWVSIGGLSPSAPSAIYSSLGTIVVFVQGEDSALWLNTFDGRWTGWESAGGTLSSGPGAVARVSGYTVFAQAPNGGLQQATFDGSSWSAWTGMNVGITFCEDIRTSQIHQLASPEIDFRLFTYASQITGSQVAVPLSTLTSIDVGRRVVLQDGATVTAQVVTAAEPISALPGGPNDHLSIGLTPGLTTPFNTATSVLLGNVARSTHGQTVANEILGDGNAAGAFQTFKLQKQPLTYIPSAKSPAGQSTLQVIINSQQWNEVPSLYGQSTRQRVFVSRMNDDGTTTLEFGDGLTAGATIPSGRGNVTASYRQGSGLAGRVKAGQLSIPMARPVGLKSVINPADASGGADSEVIDQARCNAPASVKTLGRAVALDDFAWLATASGEVAKAFATWVWNGWQRAVFLTVAGQAGLPLSPDLLATLYSGLTAARDPNHPLFVDNVCLAPIVLSANIQIVDSYVQKDVIGWVNAAVTSYFSFDNQNFAAPIHLSEVYAMLQDVTGVSFLDITTLQFKGYQTWTPAQLQARGATGDAVQPHLRIFPARPNSGPAAIDPLAMSCSAVVGVLPAEQAHIAVPSTDILLTFTGGLT